jgi:DNA gyrase inhibitor GyrI
MALFLAILVVFLKYHKLVKESKRIFLYYNLINNEFKKVVDFHFNSTYDLEVEAGISKIKNGEKAMIKEKFENLTISYIRRIGEYGPKNMELMESFKNYLKSRSLFNHEMIILGIALDNPELTAADKLRYDVGIVTGKDGIEGLERRKIDDGTYAVFEVEHTQKEVQSFWENYSELAIHLNIDDKKPMLERYTLEKINNHLCEFCIPLKK